MRVLFVYTDFPWPAIRGNRVRALSQLEALSSLPEISSVRLFSLHEDRVTANDRDALRSALPKVGIADPVYHPVHLFRDLRYVPRVAWLRLARGVPYLAGKWDAPAVRSALATELQGERYDVVWLGALGLARYLPLVRQVRPDAKVVIDTHNVDSDIWAQYASRQRGPKRVMADAEWRAARRFERDALRAADAVATISEADARGLRELAGVDPVYVPQIAPPEPRARTALGPHLLYVGYLGWHPNVLGLDWFFTEVWPRVRVRLPEARLDVAGSGLATDGAGRAIVAPEWRVPGVSILGFVPDLASLYDRAAVLIAPILEGSGVRMKLVDAFRNGVPVVTTPQGAAGLPIVSGREAFVAEDAASFAERVVEVATSTAVQERLRASAHAFLERHHSRRAAGDALRELFDRARVRSELEVDERLAAVGGDD